MNETIVAQCTAVGRASVGMLRLSGPQALQIAQTITKSTLSVRHAKFATFYDVNADVIDMGLALFFQGPNSFTGEDIVELHGHGSPIVLDRLLKTALELGARIAKPGEFSERAFLNDKMDLAQAEAIADLIESNSIQASRSALRSLSGEFSKKIHALVEELNYLRVYVEAAIDFPEEEIDFLKESHIEKTLQSLLAEIEAIQANAKQGILMREGITIVIAGLPNAGKSTLLNALSGREVAIVTEMPGTTRDVMRETIQIDGLPIHIIDTAGLRDSEDIVEQEGIRRAWAEIEKADHLFVILDMSEHAKSDHYISQLQTKFPPQVGVTWIYNKIDLEKEDPKKIQHELYISAKYHQGIDLLKTHLKEIAGLQEQTEGIFMARRRHLDAIQRANTLITQGYHQFKSKVAGELLAEDLRHASLALSEITGEFTTEDLLGRIFSTFCIGK